MEDHHVQARRADQQNLGEEIAVLKILGGVGNEQQKARGGGNGERAPGQRQDCVGDAAHGPVERGEPKQPQINHKNRADYQANRDHVHRFNQGKQQIVLADVVGESAVFEIRNELGKRKHHPAWV